VSLGLRWTEQATAQLGAIAEYIGLASPIYAEQVVDRIVARLRQAQQFPDSGRHVAEAGSAAVRELIEPPYRIVYRVQNSVIDVVAILHGRQDLGMHLPR
jgi:toxin ParE1/3/4